jgi:prepilin-type N-terminal cleavage/methylation domain-containing protein
MKKKKKRAVTLIEIMIVILLIGLIGGALAFNMRGSMDEGKIFKTKQNISRIEDILTLAAASTGESESEIAKNWEWHVKKSPLAKGEETTKDGWNTKFKVEEKDGQFIVSSKKLKEIEEKRAKTK